MLVPRGAMPCGSKASRDWYPIPTLGARSSNLAGRGEHGQRRLRALVRVVCSPQFPYPFLLHDYPGKDALTRGARRVVRIPIAFHGPLDVHQRNVGPQELDAYLLVGPCAVAKLRAVLFGELRHRRCTPFAVLPGVAIANVKKKTISH